MVPALAGYELHPTARRERERDARSAAARSRLKSEAGLVRGQLMTDLRSPDFTFSRAPPRRAAEPRSDPQESGAAERHHRRRAIDLTLPSNPPARRRIERLGGHVHVQRPRVVALGYEAQQVRAQRSVQGTAHHPGRAQARAYGGVGDGSRAHRSARGPARRCPTTCRARAGQVDLRRLPASTRAPKLDTVLSLADYHVQGTAATASGSATLNQSLGRRRDDCDGHRRRFRYSCRAHLTYAASGTLGGHGRPTPWPGARDRRRSTMSAMRDGSAATSTCRPSGTTLDELTLSATGTLRIRRCGARTCRRWRSRPTSPSPR